MTIKPRNLASESTPLESENRKFLSDVFSHPKCRHFTEKDREKVEKAFILALWAHRKQERAGGGPYITHVMRTVKRFLEITKKEQVSAADVIVTILHDVIEDHPRYLSHIHEQKGEHICRRVLSISKPGVSVMEATFGYMTQLMLSNPWRTINESYFLKKFVSANVRELQSHTSLYTHLLGMLPLKSVDYDSLKNYQFFWMIASLSEDDFEIKCADRLDNLDDLDGVGGNYIKKNLISTKVYIEKANALGRKDLVKLLEDGLMALKIREAKLPNGLQKS